MAGTSSVSPEIRTDLIHYGVVTNVISNTQFEATGLAGLGDGALVGYSIILATTLGTIVTPFYAKQSVVISYGSRVGTITHISYTSSLAVGDQFILLHPNISNVANISELQRLITKLNPVSTIDSLGDVVFHDDFKDGITGWELLGAGASREWVASGYGFSGFCIELTTGAVINNYAAIQRYFPPILSKCGLEVSLELPGTYCTVDIIMEFLGGNLAQDVGYYYRRPAGLRLMSPQGAIPAYWNVYYGYDAIWTIIPVSEHYFSGGTGWQPVKLVADFVTSARAIPGYLSEISLLTKTAEKQRTLELVISWFQEENSPLIRSHQDSLQLVAIQAQL